MILRLDSDAGTSLLIANDGVDTGYRLTEGADFGDVVWRHQFSGQRGTQGAKATQGIPDNRPVVLPIRVVGTSKDDFASKLSTLSTVVDEMRRYGGSIVWRSASQSYRQTFRVLTGSGSLERWGQRAETKWHTILIASFVCEPYIRGESMHHDEQWSTDNVNAGWADYTADAGALTDVAVSGGQLTSSANHSTEKRLIHTGHGYTYGDCMAVLEHTPGATLGAYKAGVILKRVDANNYLECYVSDNGSVSRLRIDKVVAGTPTNIATMNLGTRLANGVTATVMGRIEGNTVHALAWDSAREVTSYSISIFYLGAPGDYTREHTLTGAEVTTFGHEVEGSAGIIWTPQASGATLERFELRPWVYWRTASESFGDDYSNDTSADYTTRLGTGGDWSVSGGVLSIDSASTQVLVTSNEAAALTHGRVQAKVTTSSTMTGEFTGVVAKWIDASNILVSYIEAENGDLELWKRVSATWALVGSAAISGGVSASTAYWIDLEIVGNEVRTQCWSSDPAGGATPTATVSATLSGADATALGNGVAGSIGIHSAPSGSGTGESYDDLVVRNYGTSGGAAFWDCREWPISAYVETAGQIPGDGPALGEITWTVKGFAQQEQAWALFAWAPRPGAENLVGVKGCFDGAWSSPTGWITAGVGGVVGSSTSMGGGGGGGKHGSNYAILTTSGAGSGTAWRIWHHIRAGVTYTAEVWARHPTNTPNGQVGLGVAGDISKSSATAISTTWTLHTVTWTPSSDYDGCYVSFELDASSAVYLDSFNVYEGTTAPTRATQTQGRGGLAPLGVIPGIVMGQGIITDTGARFGQSYQQSWSGSGTSLVQVYVDPGLLVEDDYAEGDIAVEIWARVKTASTVTSPGIRAYFMGGGVNDALGYEEGRRYPHETGSVVLSYAAPASDRWRVHRLGTISLDAGGPGTLTVELSAGASGGDTRLDYIMLVPARARCLGPTAQDRSAGGYPYFVERLNEEQERVVRADLSVAAGFAAETTPRYPSSGLGGSLIEIPPGEFVLIPWLTEGVPDDGTEDVGADLFEGIISLDVTPRWHYLRT